MICPEEGSVGKEEFGRSLLSDVQQSILSACRNEALCSKQTNYTTDPF